MASLSLVAVSDSDLGNPERVSSERGHVAGRFRHDSAGATSFDNVRQQYTDTVEVTRETCNVSILGDIEDPDMPFKSFSLIVVPLLALGTYLLFHFANPTTLGESGRRLAGCTVLIAGWWLMETLPLGITSLLPIALFPPLGISGSKDVCAQYATTTCYLFFGGFQIAFALEKTGLHLRIAMLLLRCVGTKPHNIILGFMLAVSILSMFLSNTSTTLMMLPVAKGVLAAVVREGEESTFGTALMLGIAYSASAGGMGTLIGTPPNGVLVAVGKDFGISPDFLSWMVFAAPLAMFIVVITWVYLIFWFKIPRTNLPADHPVQAILSKPLGPMSQEELRIAAVFMVTLMGWMSRSYINKAVGWTSDRFGDETVSVTAILVLFMVTGKDKEGRTRKLMDWPTVMKTPWDVLLLFGGGFALAGGFKQTGLSTFIGQALAVISALPSFFITLVTTILVGFLTNITSNAATANGLLPIVGELACEISLSPAQLMIPTTLACSCAFMLPVGTPPNAIVFASGAVTMTDMIKTGTLLNLGVTVLIAMYMHTIGALCFSLDVNDYPCNNTSQLVV